MAGAGANPKGSTLRLALTSMGAAGVEWYDFFVYGTAAALVFPHIFFSPDLSPLVAQMAAFSTFAVGFVARPLGGIVFGHFGDLYGRKKTLVAALLTMGVSTLLVGLLPTYQTIGAAAPIALILLRFAQGVAVGGQWGAAALIAIENAPEGRRGLFGSFVQIGVPAGVILANVAFIVSDGLMSRDAFEAWGWRIPFLLSVVVVGLAIYVNSRMQESREFTAMAEKRGAEVKGAGPRRSPILRVIASSWQLILLAGGSFIASNACFYIIITWVISYGTSQLELPRETVLGCIMFGSVLMIPALILVAHLSDRVGRFGIFRLGCITTGIWSLVFFPLLETGTLGMALAIGVALCSVALMYGPQAALFAELFPTELRYSGASLGYQVGVLLGGGFAPMIATALFAYYGSSVSVAIYMAAACFISMVCVTFLHSRRRGAITSNADGAGSTSAPVVVEPAPTGPAHGDR